MTNQETLENLAFAIQAEVSAYVFYKNAIKKIRDPELIETLEELAQDEVDHFKVLESQYDSLHRSERWITYKDALKVGGLPEIDERISELQQSLLDELASLTTQEEILQMGLIKEQQAYEFYKSQLEKTTEPDGRNALEQLMNFELGHVRKLENWIKRTS
jgi:rubrerythrin